MDWKLYIIHFDRPYKHARHYLGIAKDIDRRMKEHKTGQGARLLQVLKENQIGFSYAVIGEFEDYSQAKGQEKYLKKVIKNSKRYCPLCKSLEIKDLTALDKGLKMCYTYSRELILT